VTSKEKAGLGRPVQQPEVVDHCRQHKGEACQQGLMGSLQVLVLVADQIPVELLGQVRGAEVGLVGIGGEDPHGKEEAGQP